MAGEIPQEQQCTFVKPLPQPSSNEKGVTSVVFSTHIAAPPLECVQLVLDSGNYKKWNKFVPRVIIQKPSTVEPSALPASLAHLASQETQLLPGAEFCFECHMDLESEASRPTYLQVSVLEEMEYNGRKGFRLSWKSQGHSWFIRAERTQEFILSEDGGTDYYNKETFYGLLAHSLELLVGKSLKKALDSWKDGLKKEAEENRSDRTAAV